MEIRDGSILAFMFLMKNIHLPKTRNAAVIHHFGGINVFHIEELPLPVPSRGQFLIEVDFASVNTVDYKIRKGKYKMFRPELPAIIGRDISGTIRNVGVGTKGPFKIGDTVFGMLDYPRGAYTRYTVATARELALRPDKLAVKDAGALGVAALTAWQGLFDHGRLKLGERVLIHGAAGGVGHLAVQFAKWRGAYVIATAGKHDLNWVKKLGADRVIDYKNEFFENVIGNVDLVYDLIAGATLERSWQVLKEREGRIISTLDHPNAKLMAQRHRARWVHMVVTVKNKQLAEIARLMVKKKVRVEIAKTFPLDQIQSAHKLMEQGHVRGKIMLNLR
jgi:NADPH:quinone reductase-like Zn-dependent oxidoreductase